MQGKKKEALRIILLAIGTVLAVFAVAIVLMAVLFRLHPPAPRDYLEMVAMLEFGFWFWVVASIFSFSWLMWWFYGRTMISAGMEWFNRSRVARIGSLY